MSIDDILYTHDIELSIDDLVPGEWYIHSGWVDDNGKRQKFANQFKIRIINGILKYEDGSGHKKKSFYKKDIFLYVR